MASSSRSRRKALINAHVLAAERLHTDETTMPIRARGETDTGRIWTYVRDDRPFGAVDPQHPDAYVDPQAWLADVLARIAATPQGQLAKLLTCNGRMRSTTAITA